MQHTTVEIMGGLGNQLFQIFTLVAYCLRHKCVFYFANQPINHGQRKKTYWTTPLLQTLEPFIKIASAKQQTLILKEKDFHYAALPFPNQNIHLCLFGYFQSYKYFQDQAPVLFKLLRLEKTKSAIRARTTYNYANTLAIHFRVGDYVALPNHYPLMTLAYYTAALEQFLLTHSTPTSSSPNWHILYFCEQNDETYVKTQFISKLQADPRFLNNFTFQCIDHELVDWEQLIVMSLCRHHIIANSTFSWWGAYLAQGNAEVQGNTEVQGNAETPSQVYYPKSWFGPAMGNKNMADLFPTHWRQINIWNTYEIGHIWNRATLLSRWTKPAGSPRSLL